MVRRNEEEGKEREGREEEEGREKRGASEEGGGWEGKKKETPGKKRGSMEEEEGSEGRRREEEEGSEGRMELVVLLEGFDSEGKGKPKQMTSGRIRRRRRRDGEEAEVAEEGSGGASEQPPPNSHRTARPPPKMTRSSPISSIPPLCSTALDRTWFSGRSFVRTIGAACSSPDPGRGSASSWWENCMTPWTLWGRAAGGGGPSRGWT